MCNKRVLEMEKYGLYRRVVSLREGSFQRGTTVSMLTYLWTLELPGNVSHDIHSISPSYTNKQASQTTWHTQRLNTAQYLGVLKQFTLLIVSAVFFCSCNTAVPLFWFLVNNSELYILLLSIASGNDNEL